MKLTRRSSEIFFCLLTLALSVAFGAFLGSLKLTDPFLYYDVAFTKSSLTQQQLSFPETGPYASLIYVPGREMLMLRFSDMMGIAVETLQFLPLGSIFVSLSLYLLALRMLESPPLACLVTLYLTTNLSHATALYSIFGYAFGVPLYFSFLFLWLRLRDPSRRIVIILALIIFVAAHLIHYTIASWIILTLLGINVFQWLESVWALRSPQSPSPPPRYIFFACLVIFLAFNQAVYKSFLPVIGTDAFDSALQRFLNYLAVTEVSATTSPYLFTRPVSVGLISTVTLLLILLPVLIGVIYDLQKLIRRNQKPDTLQMLALPIFVTGMADALSYSVRGSISTKFFSMIFPLLAILYARRASHRMLPYGLAVLLLATSIAKVGLFSRESYVISPETASVYTRIEPSRQWLNAHLNKPAYLVLADLNLYGQYLVASVDTGAEPRLYSYTLEHYETVVGTQKPEWETTPDLVAMDLVSQEPTIGFVWTVLDPLKTYRTEVERNSAINLIYDDGIILLAKPR